MNHTNFKSQRGAAALVVTLMLFLALALASLGLHRHLIAEQRAAANQARATQAFEAAEAGLEWALAQLNSTQRIGTDCQPDTDPAATTPTFRERTLSLARTTGAVTPTVQDVSLASFCPSACSSGSTTCPPRQQVRSLAVVIAATLVSDARVTRSVRSEARVRADAVVGACAS